MEYSPSYGAYCCAAGQEILHLLQNPKNHVSLALQSASFETCVSEA